MKFGMRVAIGVFVTSLAGALFVIKDAGKMEIAEEAGRFLAKESCFCLWNGQEGRYVLAELLGGQSYFEPNQALAESDAGKEKLAVVENRELHPSFRCTGSKTGVNSETRRTAGSGSVKPGCPPQKQCGGTIAGVTQCGLFVEKFLYYRFNDFCDKKAV